MAYRDVEPSAPSLLPELQTSPDQSYRIQKISQHKLVLEAERGRRAGLTKKYRRGVNAIDAIDTALLTIGMATGVGGVGLLTTIIAAPVVLGLEIT